ncbi:hypothetical protein, partial [Methanoculleus sp.]|uniref:hypothetical protein n=1 Tax=Methanoculleus sp. TaxID=90427 RepID=UPI002D1C5907
MPYTSPAFLSRGIPIHFAGTPTPPAPATLLPRPHRGGGVRAWRYLVGSRIRLFPTYPLALDRGDI